MDVKNCSTAELKNFSLNSLITNIRSMHEWPCKYIEQLVTTYRDEDDKKALSRKYKIAHVFLVLVLLIKIMCRKYKKCK